MASATFEEAHRYDGRGITEKITDLLTDGFIDLQGDRITQARLLVRGDRLGAVPLAENEQEMEKTTLFFGKLAEFGQNTAR